VVMNGHDGHTTDLPVAGPQRTCIATRRVLPVDRLLRCVAVTDPDGTRRIVPDPERRLPGRGAWITPTVEAYETAVRRRAFSRALKVPAGTGADAVRDVIGTDHPLHETCGG
jgi:predicted RNA-binding protein YlxR (DUF448 family)